MRFTISPHKITCVYVDRFIGRSFFVTMTSFCSRQPFQDIFSQKQVTLGLISESVYTKLQPKLFKPTNCSTMQSPFCSAHPRAPRARPSPKRPWTAIPSDVSATQVFACSPETFIWQNSSHKFRQQVHFFKKQTSQPEHLHSQVSPTPLFQVSVHWLRPTLQTSMDLLPHVQVSSTCLCCSEQKYCNNFMNLI